MRFREFGLLIEASVISKPAKYKSGYEVSIKKTDKGKVMSDAIRALHPDFDTDSVVSISKSAAVKPAVVLKKGGSEKIKLKDINGTTVLITGSKGAIENAINDGGGKAKQSLANRGEIAEGILGAALFAKFAARSNNKTQQIKESDVISVLNGLKKHGKEEYTKTVIGKGAFKDKITFILRLKDRPYSDLLDDGKHHMLAQEFSSAVLYANSWHVQEYADEFFLNKKKDQIRIISDGVTGEKSTKIDVYVEVESPIGSAPKKLNLNISLKSGAVKQFGQVGGVTFDKLESIFGEFGISLDRLETKFNKITDSEEQIAFVYETAAKRLAASLQGDKKEKVAMRKLLKGIEKFANGGDKSVRIVHFKNSDFDVLDPSKLSKMVKQVDLTAVYVPAGNGKPQVFIIDKATKTPLIRIRAKIENKVDKDGVPYIYTRNIVEKEPLFVKYTKVSDKKKKELVNKGKAKALKKSGLSANKGGAKSKKK